MTNAITDNYLSQRIADMLSATNRLYNEMDLNYLRKDQTAINSERLGGLTLEQVISTATANNESTV